MPVNTQGPYSNRPPVITREDIAEIHDQRAERYYESARVDVLVHGGPSMIDLIRKSVDCERQAEGYRETDTLEDKRNLEQHKYYTSEAWRLNRRKHREEQAREGLGKAAQILKVVK